MPIHLPHENLGVSEIAVHEQWMTFFERNLSDQLKEQFPQHQRSTSGYIIVRWEEGKPVEYYMAHVPCKFERLDSATIPENPFMYLTLNGIMKRVRILRTRERGNIGIAFWKHPEAHLPRSQFALASAGGKRMPGSARR